MLGKLWAVIRNADQKSHNYMSMHFPKQLRIIDRAATSIFSTISHPLFPLIVALLLVVLVATNVIDIIVAVAIIGAWLVAMVWISRAEWIGKLFLPARLIVLISIGFFLAWSGAKFGQWALVKYNEQKQIMQKQPTEKNESIIKPPPITFKEPPAKSPPKQQEPQHALRLPPSPPKESPADVTLRFVYQKSPALMIANRSDSLARDIKWTVALWNMDLPDHNDPLPIPINTFDWIKPHDEGGPQNLFDSPLVVSLLKPGNRLFGSASVDCPACARGRTYIVYIVWGQGGWFSEVENEKSGHIIIPKNFLRDSREKYFKFLEAEIPENSRVAIGER